MTDLLGGKFRKRAQNNFVNSSVWESESFDSCQKWRKVLCLIVFELSDQKQNHKSPIIGDVFFKIMDYIKGKKEKKNCF